MLSFLGDLRATVWGKRRETKNARPATGSYREGLTRNADAPSQSKCFLMPNILEVSEGSWYSVKAHTTLCTDTWNVR